LSFIKFRIFVLENTSTNPSPKRKKNEEVSKHKIIMEVNDKQTLEHVSNYLYVRRHRQHTHMHTRNISFF